MAVITSKSGKGRLRDRTRALFRAIEQAQHRERHDGHGERRKREILVAWVEREADRGIGADHGGDGQNQTQNHRHPRPVAIVGRAEQFQEGRHDYGPTSGHACQARAKRYRPPAGSPRTASRRCRSFRTYILSVATPSSAPADVAEMPTAIQDAKPGCPGLAPQCQPGHREHQNRQQPCRWPSAASSEG